MTNPTIFSCECCGLQYIDIDEYKIHINGRKHQRNVRLYAQNVVEDGTAAHECIYCHIKFSGQQYYEQHLNTKGHRQHIRKLKEKRTSTSQRSASVGNTDLAFTVIASKETVETTTETEFIRKKYKAHGKIENKLNKSYVTNLTAYLSLKLALDIHVQDFKISVYDKKWGSFGDIVIEIPEKERTGWYVIKCKQISESVKQINSLKEAKVIMEKEYANIIRFKNKIDFDSVKFSIFTTANVSSDFCKSIPISYKTLNVWNSLETETIEKDAALSLQPFKKNHIINVSNDPENVFQIVLSREHMVESVRLPQVLFFSDQRIHPRMLNYLLKRTFDSYPNIDRTYVKYIENWMEGKLGGNYKLTKKDIILQLGGMLLNQFTIAPKLIHLDEEKFEIWEKVLSQVDLIMVKNESFIISKMCQPINKLIEATFETNIDTISRTINIRNKINSKTNSILKSYLYEEVSNHDNDIPLNLIYKVMWKWGKIPLLMCTENNEEAKDFILEVISMMKKFGVHKKFLIKSAYPNIIKNVNGDVVVFTNADVIRNKIELNEIYIKVTDTFKISLRDISETDPCFLKWVSPAILLDMTLEKYSFIVDEQIARAENFQEESDLKIVLNKNIREQLALQLKLKSNIEKRNILGIDPLAIRF